MESQESKLRRFIARGGKLQNQRGCITCKSSAKDLFGRLRCLNSEAPKWMSIVNEDITCTKWESMEMEHVDYDIERLEEREAEQLKAIAAVQEVVDNFYKAYENEDRESYKYFRGIYDAYRYAVSLYEDLTGDRFGSNEIVRAHFKTHTSASDEDKEIFEVI